MRRVIGIMMIICGCLGGCADACEPNGRAFITTVAVDYSNGAFCAALTAANLENKEDGHKADAFAQGRGGDVSSAVTEAGRKLKGEPWLGQTKVIALGEGLLADGAAFKAAVFGLEQTDDLNCAALVAAAEDAAKVVNPKENGGVTPAAYLPDYYAAKKPAVKVTLGELAAALRAGEGFALPRLAPGETAPNGAYAEAGEAAD